VEAISSLHGISLVPTHQRGSKAINGIFLSRSLLEEAKGGFLQFGKSMVSNHRAVWIDLPVQYFNMLHTTDITRAMGRQLKCQDPRIVEKYNKYLATVLKQENLMMKLLEAMGHTDLDYEWANTNVLENLDQQWTQAKIDAECHCHKINTRHLPWTPSLMVAIYKVLYWKGIQKRLKGGKISGTVLQK